jgi:hypothetical protein
MTKNPTFSSRSKLRGGIVSQYQHVFEKPSWRTGTRPWTTLVKINNLHVYGSSIPHEDVYNCMATLKFYMHVKNIKRIISLHACDIATNADHCNGTLYPDKTIDQHYESRVWNALKDMSKLHNEDPYIEFVNHYIQDMTAGTLTEWSALYNYNYANPNQITLIHCAAGFGRTGSILFLIWLNSKYENNHRSMNEIWDPFLGFPNGFDMIINLQDEFFNNIILDNNPVQNDECNDDIIAFDPANIVDELFNVMGKNRLLSLYLINLLITRINYTRICLGFGFSSSQTQTIFLYKLVFDPALEVETYDSSTFSRILANPDEISLADIDTIAKNLANPYGIKL